MAKSPPKFRIGQENLEDCDFYFLILDVYDHLDDQMSVVRKVSRAPAALLEKVRPDIQRFFAATRFEYMSYDEIVELGAAEGTTAFFSSDGNRRGADPHIRALPTTKVRSRLGRPPAHCMLPHPVLPHSWHLDPCNTTSPTRPIKVATRTRQDDARPTG